MKENKCNIIFFVAEFITHLACCIKSTLICLSRMQAMSYITTRARFFPAV
jgi:hypothetical protein